MEEFSPLGGEGSRGAQAIKPAVTSARNDKAESTQAKAFGYCSLSFVHSTLDPVFYNL